MFFLFEAIKKGRKKEKAREEEKERVSERYIEKAGKNEKARFENFREQFLPFERAYVNAFIPPH